MKKYLLILAAILLLWGCIAEDRTECTNPRGVFVSLTVRPERMSSVTRSADETAIRDLNLYLYDDNSNVVLHRYQTSATLRFECLPGDYRICIAANLGRDLGDNLLWEDFTVTHADKYDVLPMAYEGDITIIPSADGMLTLPAVEVRRCVAKVSYNISVEPADIELRSVQLLSVPRSVSVFDVAARPSDDPDDYTGCPEIELSGQQAAGNSYLLPNRQGTVSSITDQRQKNPDNVPANASYLLIRAVRGSKVLAYYIYLGGNNTSDFNVRANVHYRLAISILGDSEVDTRVSSYTLDVYDSYAGNTIGGYCTYDVMGELFVEVEGDPAPLTLRGRITASQGDRDRLLVDDASIGTGRDLELANQPGLNGYFLYYDLPVYTTANSQVTYTVTVADDAGLAQSFDFRRRFANRLQVVVETADNGKGWVNVSQALYDAEISGTRNHVVMCHEMGCTLVALPAAGYRFEGWYTTDGYTQRLSSSTTYLYTPASNDASIFPKFTASTRPLDDEGTANCYIAPALNTSYSFDAATMGNGRTTLNVTPKRLSGVSARVLWETGTLSETIVKDVQYQDGRITFTTGTTHGNAVIGLLDSRGECLWSWHIWATNGALTTHVYPSGYVFMDRNLGAENLDPGDPASRGLYYQWGRKDPFPYDLAAFDYGEGFAFGTYYGEDSSTATVAWAAAHPATLLGRAADPSDPAQRLSSWLGQPSPNLWGNASTGGRPTTAGAKSIYDPCPPGWRVPPPEAWTLEQTTVSSTIEGGCYLYTGSVWPYYPYAGLLHVMPTGKEMYVGVGIRTQLWTNAPGSPASDPSRVDATTAVSFGVLPPEVLQLYRQNHQAAAYPVRCVKE